jgi:excisionase family DNA binding protein
MITEKLLMKPIEVAESLGISRGSAYELIASGRLPGVVRIGKSVRVSTEKLRDWVKSASEDAQQGEARS